MTVEELITLCRDQQKLTGSVDAPVILNLSKPRQQGGYSYVALWPGGPKGEIIADQIPGPGVIARFRASDLLTGLLEAGLRETMNNA